MSISNMEETSYSWIGQGSAYFAGRLRSLMFLRADRQDLYFN
jgi:hypothetical protein